MLRAEHLSLCSSPEAAVLRVRHAKAEVLASSNSAGAADAAASDDGEPPRGHMRLHLGEWGSLEGVAARSPPRHPPCARGVALCRRGGGEGEEAALPRLPCHAIAAGFVKSHRAQHGTLSGAGWRLNARSRL